MNLDSFKKAYSTHTAGYFGECECGTTYYHDDTAMWEADADHIDRLLLTSKKIDTPVRFVSFDGYTYVEQCDCWHKSARQIMRYIDKYRHQITTYLNTERDRMIKEAEQAKIVEILSREDEDEDEDNDERPF